MKPIFRITESPLFLRDLDRLLKQEHTLEIDPIVQQVIEDCRTYLEQKLKSTKAPIYGINTGFGSLCNVKISDDDLEQLQVNLVRSHACGMGDKLPDDLSRLILFLKIKNMSIGYSGVRYELVDRMVSLYNKGIVPSIYELGSLGASGDLAPLAHLGLTIIGEDSENKTDSFGLREKEGLAILNGTQFCLAYGAKCTILAEKMYHLANTIAGISLEAFLCDEDPFHPAINKVRKHKGQEYTSREIKKLRADSPLLNLTKISVQDPYSFRCIPQVHGASYDGIVHVKSIMETELNSVTDNPLIFPEEDRIMSGGNFHAQPLGMALDHLTLALSELGSISERRIYQLINGDRNLPQFLVEDAGLNSGFMIIQYTAASIASQNKQLCTPATADSIVSCKGQEDHVSMAANAATRCLRVVDNIKRILSLELLVAAQAMEFRRPHHSSAPIEKIIQGLRRCVPKYEEDRIMRTDIVLAEKYIDQLLSESEIE